MSCDCGGVISPPWLHFVFQGLLKFNSFRVDGWTDIVLIVKGLCFLSCLIRQFLPDDFSSAGR